MAIPFKPTARSVVLCNFASGFHPPEMCKVRPVVVLSPKRDNRNTCIVVPLSTVAPRFPRKFHHQLDLMSMPAQLRDRASWVKGNLVTAVGLWRIERLAKLSKSSEQETFASHKVTQEDWDAIKRAVIAAFAWESH